MKAEEAKVLIVDDNQMNLFVLSQLLEEFGIMADCVPSGMICLRKAAKKSYDLIFMDHMMPEMDGIETFRKLKEIPDFSATVVALTANSGDDQEQLFKENGFAEDLVKPAELEDIRYVLNKYLQLETNDENDTIAYVEMTEEKSRKRQNMLECGFEVIDELLANGMEPEEYEDLLYIFLGESERNVVQAQRYVLEDNMREYAVIVHGLKNDAAMISDDELSNHARKHEEESKMNNTKFVEEDWLNLKCHWEETNSRIKKYFSLQSNI